MDRGSRHRIFAQRLTVDRMKLKGWLFVVAATCGICIGAVIFLEGIGFFRDIERTEMFIVGGWGAVCVITVLVTVARTSARRANRPKIYNRN